MRITNKMIYSSMQDNINKAMVRMDSNYEQLSTGKRIQKPSDDPVGLIRSLRLSDSIDEASRYVENSEDAAARLNASDSALNELTTVMHRLETLAVAGANDTLPKESRYAIREEVRELKEHVLQIANTQYNGKYVFAGQNTLEEAYDENFNYNGDNNPISTEIGAGVTLETSIIGPDIFGTLFSDIDSFITNLDAENADEISTVDIANIQDSLDQILNARSTMGAKVNRLEQNVSRLETLDAQYTELLSKIEDADIAELATQLKMQETVYQAALSVGAKMLQVSLVNYI